MLVEYICARRSEKGGCHENGIQFNVYVKRENDTVTDPELVDGFMDRVSELATAVCLDPNDLQVESGKMRWRFEF